MLDHVAMLRRHAPSAATMGVLLVALSSLCVIVFPFSLLTALPWLFGVGVGLWSTELRNSEKIMLFVVGFVPFGSALGTTWSKQCDTSYYQTDATGHVLHSTTGCSVTSADKLPTPIMLIPAIVAVLIYARVVQRRLADDHRTASPSGHDRTEAQSVEIVLALFLGGLAGLSVFSVSWLLRHLVTTSGSSVWWVATASLAVVAGLGVLFRQLLHAGRGGL